LARAAAEACTRDGISITDVEMWRDVGWSFVAKFDGKAFEIYYARYGAQVRTALPSNPFQPSKLATSNPCQPYPQDGCGVTIDIDFDKGNMGAVEPGALPGNLGLYNSARGTFLHQSRKFGWRYEGQRKICRVKL